MQKKVYTGQASNVLFFTDNIFSSKKLLLKNTYIISTHTQHQTSIFAFVHRGISTIMLKTDLSELANKGTSWNGDKIPFAPPTKNKTTRETVISV